MAHIAVTCPPSPGHHNPNYGLGRELLDRGHRVTVFGLLDSEKAARDAGLEFVATGTDEFPLGFMDEQLAQMGERSGLAVLVTTMKLILRFTERGLSDSPALLRDNGIDLLIADELNVPAASAAESLGIPYVTVSAALPVLRDPLVPPIYTPWLPGGPLVRLGSMAAAILLDAMAWPSLRLVNKARRGWGLPPLPGLDGGSSRLAHVAQLPAELAFPRKHPQPALHLLGPFANPSSRAPVPFDWDRLDGRPLVYASMGTVNNRLRHVFATIAEAVAPLDAQLVLSMGGSGDPSELGRLAGDPIVVAYAPQLQLLERASAVITHAGMNTALECLAAGVPMVAVPVGNDQPGVAARIQWSGTGRRLTLSELGVESLREAVADVLDSPHYRERARKLATTLAQRRPRQAAADLVEAVLARSAGRPVEPT